MKGQFLIAELLATPWAMHRDVLTVHAQVCARWLAGQAKLSAPDDTGFGDRISAFSARRQLANVNAGGSGIAVVPVYGTIVQRAGMITEWCGGTSTDQLAAAVRDANADDTISQIVAEFDTPGGSVFGVVEAAAVLKSSKKPIIGIANSLCASAGYWLAAQCAELYVTPGGQVGSIGVFMAHEDWSKAMEEQGVKTSLVSAGQFKVEGNPYEPLTDEAREFMQSQVDVYYQAFVKAVASGRGLPISQVRDGMGQGRLLGADAALDQKMVDGIMTFDDLVRKMQKSMRSTRGAGAIVDLPPVVAEVATNAAAVVVARLAAEVLPEAIVGAVTVVEPEAVAEVVPDVVAEATAAVESVTEDVVKEIASAPDVPANRLNARKNELALLH